jgi:hypothetical protein
MPTKGVVLYEGPSRFDADRTIVAILTLESNNTKTGGIPQVWIVDKDIAPHEGIKTGEDKALCGDCRLRNNGCYVLTYQAPRSVRAAYLRGSYLSGDAGQAWLRKTGAKNPWKAVRIGAYGDPCAVPVSVWDNLSVSVGTAKILGYTQQWNKEENKPYQKYCMASSFSTDEAKLARANGWRYFRVRDPDDESAELQEREVVCPASAEQNYRLSCSQCRACTGSRGDFDQRASVTIAAHGAKFKLNKIKALFNHLVQD